MYRPTPTELAHLFDHARQQAPHLLSRINKAAQLIADNDIDFIEDRYRVPSFIVAASAQGDFYDVTVEPCPSCTCPDFGKTVYKSTPCCKHTLAATAYLKGLTDHLAKRIYGDMCHRFDRRMVQQHPDTYLIRLNQTNIVANLTTPAVRFKTKWKYNRQWFATDVDAITFACWLQQAPPLPMPCYETDFGKSFGEALEPQPAAPAPDLLAQAEAEGYVIAQAALQKAAQTGMPIECFTLDEALNVLQFI